jgi:hypothetical protein
MKVLAIRDYVSSTGWYITEGEWYACDDIVFDESCNEYFYSIVCDDQGEECLYGVDYFKTIEQLRNEKLNIILNG